MTLLKRWGGEWISPSLYLLDPHFLNAFWQSPNSLDLFFQHVRHAPADPRSLDIISKSWGSLNSPKYKEQYKTALKAVPHSQQPNWRRVALWLNVQARSTAKQRSSLQKVEYSRLFRFYNPRNFNAFSLSTQTICILEASSAPKHYLLSYLSKEINDGG